MLLLKEEERKIEEREKEQEKAVREGILEKEALGKKVEYRKLLEELEKARTRYDNAMRWYYQERFGTLSSSERDRLWKEELPELKRKIASLKEEGKKPVLDFSAEEREIEKRNPLPLFLLIFAFCFLLLFILKISGLSIPVPGSLSLLIALLLSCISFAVFYGEKEKRKSELGKRQGEEERRKKEEALKMASLEELLLRSHKLEEMGTLEGEVKERKTALDLFLSKEGEPDIKGEEEKSFSLEERQKKLEEIREEREALRDRIREKREEREERAEALIALTEQERRLSSVREERVAMEERIHILQLCKDYMEKAKEAFSAQYSAPILTAFCKYFRELSGLELQFVMTDDLELEFLESGIRRPTAYLSEGLQDLCRLSLKLAIFDAMFPEKNGLLFLDDPFCHFDDEKGKKGLELLKKIAEDRQILYFSCSAVRAV